MQGGRRWSAVSAQLSCLRPDTGARRGPPVLRRLHSSCVGSSWGSPCEQGALPLFRALASPRSCCRAWPTGLGVIQSALGEEGTVCLGDPEGRGSHHGTHRDWALLGARTHSSTCERGFLGADLGAHLVLRARTPAPTACLTCLADAAASGFLQRNKGSWY